MNNLQKIASDISGYHGIEKASGAQDDGYYEQKGYYAKLGYIFAFSAMAEEVVPVNFHQAEKIVGFLEMDFLDSHEMNEDFNNL